MKSLDFYIYANKPLLSPLITLPLSRRLNDSTDAVLSANHPSSNRDLSISSSSQADLDLVALLHSLQPSLGESLGSLPPLLAGLLLLLIAILIGVLLLVLSLRGLLLGLRLLNMDVAFTLSELDDNITIGRDGELDRAAGRDSSVTGEDGVEVLIADEDTDGVGKVRSDGNGGVLRLLDILNLILGDKGSLDGSTKGRKLRGVDGGGVNSRSVDSSGGGEDGADALGNLRDVGRTAGKDDGVNVEKVELGLLDNVLSELDDLVKNVLAEDLEAETVDSGVEIETTVKGVGGERGGGGDGESALDKLALELQLGQSTGILAGVDLVLLDELLGEMVDKELVELCTTEFVVVNGSENGVHTATDGNDSSIRTGATDISNEDGLVLSGAVILGGIGKSGSGRLLDELENLDIGVLRSLDESSLLGLVEVGRDRDDGASNLLADEVGSGANKAAEVTSSNLRDGEGAGSSAILFDDIEGRY